MSHTHTLQLWPWQKSSGNEARSVSVSLDSLSKWQARQEAPSQHLQIPPTSSPPYFSRTAECRTTQSSTHRMFGSLYSWRQCKGGGGGKKKKKGEKGGYEEDKGWGKGEKGGAPPINLLHAPAAGFKRQIQEKDTNTRKRHKKIQHTEIHKICWDWSKYGRL